MKHRVAKGTNANEGPWTLSFTSFLVNQPCLPHHRVKSWGSEKWKNLPPVCSWRVAEQEAAPGHLVSMTLRLYLQVEWSLRSHLCTYGMTGASASWEVFAPGSETVTKCWTSLHVRVPENLQVCQVSNAWRFDDGSLRWGQHLWMSKETVFRAMIK